MLVYRRRRRGDMVEPLEIVAAHGGAAEEDALFGGDAFQILEVEKRTEVQIYYVRMPQHMRVRPPDWRDLAYDHEEVRKRIVVCVTDNCRCFMAEPINAHLLHKVEKALMLVLEDLRAIMDLTSVICEPAETPGRYVVSVAFEHKNGTPRTLAIEIDNDDLLGPDER